MIINIRGTSGSGKSTLVRALGTARGGMNAKWGVDPTGKSGRDAVLGYVTEDGQIGIPGRYVTACGGCDTIKTQDEAQRRVRWLAALHPHVVFEGLLISHIYGRWGQMATEYAPMGWVFAPAPRQSANRKPARLPQLVLQITRQRVQRTLADVEPALQVER